VIDATAEQSAHNVARNADEYEVVVVGAGLAGGSLALRLARAGVKVALIDPAKFPREKICGEFLSPECWAVFDRLGLTEEIERLDFHPIRRVRLTTPRGRVLESEFSDPDGRPALGLGRAALDHLILRAAAREGAVVLESTRVKEPILRDGRVVGVIARKGSDEPVELRAAVTVAADGRNSALVPKTGVSTPRSWFRSRYFGLKRHLSVPEENAEPEGTVGLHLVAGGYVGTCRIETGMTNLCGLLPESVLRQHRGDLDRLATAVFPGNALLGRMWESAAPLGAWKTVADVQVLTASPKLPGILYAGDSQGTIDPLGGQGMTLALLGAEMLAPFVTRALVEGGAGIALQRDYSAAWRRRFDRRIMLCRAFHHALVNPWVVDVGSVCSRISPRLVALGYRLTREPAPAS
jgi:menaquinone-9 beta-reductase